MSEYKEKKWLEDLKERKVARDSFPEKFSFKSDPHFRFYKRQFNSKMKDCRKVVSLNLLHQYLWEKRCKEENKAIEKRSCQANGWEVLKDAGEDYMWHAVRRNLGKVIAKTDKAFWNELNDEVKAIKSYVDS